MLKNKELGMAIKAALEQNNFSQAQTARKFNLKPPSITGWIQTGRISKENFEELKNWCEKTPLSHWGIDSQESHPRAWRPNNLDMDLLNAFNKLKTERQKIEIIGYVQGKVSEQKNMSNLPVSKNTKKAAA